MSVHYAAQCSNRSNLHIDASHAVQKSCITGDECKAQAGEDDKLVRGASQLAICCSMQTDL